MFYMYIFFRLVVVVRYKLFAWFSYSLGLLFYVRCSEIKKQKREETKNIIRELKSIFGARQNYEAVFFSVQQIQAFSLAS